MVVKNLNNTNIKNMIKRLKEKLIYWLSSKLLPIVNPNELIVFKNGKPFVNNVELTPSEIIGLKAEADIIGKMRLWNIIVNDLNEKTQKKVFLESTDKTDLIVGKTILYTLDVQKQFIEKMKNK